MLYVGDRKHKINLDGKKYRLASVSIQKPIESVVRLLSSDNYILKDSNGVYLVPKEVG
jgi:hypothetical protein